MNKYGSWVILRLIIGFTVAAVTLTVMGMINVGKDAFGSNMNFADMSVSDFKEGDIVHGTITETLGCAATMEESGGRITAYYYVVPYFGSGSDNPEKILIYRTGNKSQTDTLSSLKYETFNWYIGKDSGTSSHLAVERAELVRMTDQEYNACLNYIDEYIDAYYSGMSMKKIEQFKDAYHSAIVPCIVRYTAGGAGGTFLLIGVSMLGIIVVAALVFIAKTRSTGESHTYIGSAYNPIGNANLNSPTGLKNASDMYYSGNSGNIPPTRPMNGTSGASGINTSLPRQKGSFVTDYSSSPRPMPPVDKAPQRTMRREMNFDPFTGKPLNKTSLVDTVFDGQQPGASRPTQKSQLSRPSYNPVQPIGDSMPSVNPKNTEFVDLSNGGVEQESWEHRTNTAEMPKNGNIPVINPEIHSSAAMFGSIIPATAEETAARHEEKPVMPEERVTEVSPIHPPTKADNVRSSVQVEQTDPETRSIYGHMAGGEMNEVDPYTEKNVDVSNGGLELPEEEENADVRRSFPNAESVSGYTAPVMPEPAINDIRTDFPAAAFTAAAAATPEPAADDIRTDFPQASDIFAADKTPVQPEIPQQSTDAPQSDSYNIFRTSSSYTPYTSDYTGGSSYNIFKTDSKPEDKPDSGDSGNMGFPVENKEFPKLDTSFPTAGESDVGGQDDFVF